MGRGVLGSALRIELRLERAVGWLRDRFAQGETSGRFVDAVVTPTLLFCVGPLTILGSLSDGLGRGADQLLVKSVLDGFAAIAFASSLGAGASPGPPRIEELDALSRSNARGTNRA